MRLLNVAFAFAMLVSMSLVSFYACNESDSEAIADAIEDRLTDALDFNDGEKIKGDPPAENSGEAYPQISGVSAPPMLTVGAPIEIRITPDSAASLDIKHVMVYVYGASEFIKVKAELNAETGEVVITGTLTEEPEISGDFMIKLALLNSNGEGGEWALWELTIPDENNGDGDFDFDIIVPTLSCTVDIYACDDTQMQNYINNLSSTSRCQSGCEGIIDENDPDTYDAYQSCYACCLKEPMDAIGEETFVECQACIEHIGSGVDGETVDEAETRASAQEEWDNVQEIISNCTTAARK